MSILQRIFGNWRMSVGGLAVGIVLALLVMAILSLAKCEFGGWLWGILMTLIVAGPTVVGMLGTDNGQKVG